MPDLLHFRPRRVDVFIKRSACCFGGRYSGGEWRCLKLLFTRGACNYFARQAFRYRKPKAARGTADFALIARHVYVFGRQLWIVTCYKTQEFWKNCVFVQSTYKPSKLQLTGHLEFPDLQAITSFSRAYSPGQAADRGRGTLAVGRAWFATGEFPNHQGVTGAIKYVTNPDGYDVHQHTVAINDVTLIEGISGFPSRYAVCHPADVRFIERDTKVRPRL